MSNKLPALPKDGEGVLRNCAQMSKLMDCGVPQPVRDFTILLLGEVFKVLTENMDSEQAEQLMGQISDHVLGTTAK